PAERTEGHELRREPRVEHIGVSAQRPAGGFAARLLLGARNIAVARFVVPGGNLMAPPELARDAPVLDVLEPMVVGGGPVLRYELHLAAGDHREAVPRHAVHLHEPLLGEHRLHDSVATIGARYSQLVWLLRNEQILFLEIIEDPLSSLEALEALVARGDQCQQFLVVASGSNV